MGLTFFGMIGLLGALIWGQLVEGTSNLQRPLGYFGTLLASAGSCLLFYFLHVDIWSLVGSLAIGYSFAQGARRVRCLINGCCHGRQTSLSRGIRIKNPNSRVSENSGLHRKCIHVTQMYSLIWLFMMGFVLLILWVQSAHLSLIVGLYLILSGLGRFVEEGLRSWVDCASINGFLL